MSVDALQVAIKAAIRASEIILETFGNPEGIEYKSRVDVVTDTDKHIEIESPLKMETISRVTKTGIVESLSLGKWMQPFSDQKTISLNKNLVIINLPVTIGLEKYYEYVLKKMDLGDGPSEEELKAIEEEEKQDLKDQVLEYIKDGYTIH